MRFLTAFAAIGLTASAYLVCPDAVRSGINDTLTPDEQTLVEMREGIDAIMRHMQGPAPAIPDAPV